MIGQAPGWINPKESTTSALQKNAAAPERNKWMHWLRSQHLLWSESMQGPYNSGISHGNDSLGQDWFTFCNRPTRSPTDKAYSLESVQKKLNLTFVRCVRCSFGYRIRIGEDKKLSLTFVRCSFGCTRRCGNAAFMLNRPVMGSISCRLYVYNTYICMCIYNSCITTIGYLYYNYTTIWHTNRLDMS